MFENYQGLRVNPTNVNVYLVPVCAWLWPSLSHLKSWETPGQVQLRVIKLVPNMFRWNDVFWWTRPRKYSRHKNHVARFQQTISPPRKNQISTTNRKFPDKWIGSMPDHDGIDSGTHDQIFKTVDSKGGCKKLRVSDVSVYPDSRATGFVPWKIWKVPIGWSDVP